MEKLTNKEAIERLKCMRLFMKINDKASESKFLEEDYIANGMAIAALEKQIPKKPIDRCMFSECPKCGNVEIQSGGLENGK